jgi:hypothetical protein
MYPINCRDERITFSIASIINPSRWIRYRARSDLVGSDHSTKYDRNPGCGTTNGSDGKIISTPHLITINLISTMRCNFTQLSDPIGSDCRIRSDSNTMDSLLIPQRGSDEFRRNYHQFRIGFDKIRVSILMIWESDIIENNIISITTASDLCYTC